MYINLVKLKMVVMGYLKRKRVYYYLCYYIYKYMYIEFKEYVVYY